MKKIYHLLPLGVLLFIVFSCTPPAPVEIHRFEQHIFSSNNSTLTAPFSSSALLNYHPDDPAWCAMLEQFVSDPVVLDIYHTTDSLYHDLSWLEKQLAQAMHRAEKLHPGIHYNRFYTLVTADLQDYQDRILCSDHELAISIDHYAVNAMEKYNYFGLPAYIVQLSTRQHILPDCMAAIARQHILLPEGEMTLLDHAIAEGKTLYFLEQTLPNIHDTLRLRYTKEQLDWIKHNQQNVWSWLLQNRMLYTTDPAALRNLVDDAPKTNAFGDGSAPRTADYIGLQIVRAYMKKSHSTLQDLFNETDSQKILTLSSWHP